MLTEKNMLCAWHCMCVLPKKYRGVCAYMQVYNACIGKNVCVTACMHASAYCMYRHKCLYVCMYVCLYACVYCMKKKDVRGM